MPRGRLVSAKRSPLPHSSVCDDFVFQLAGFAHHLMQLVSGWQSPTHECFPARNVVLGRAWSRRRLLVLACSGGPNTSSENIQSAVEYLPSAVAVEVGLDIRRSVDNRDLP